MSTWTATHPWTAFLGVWECLSVLFGVCWCLLLSWIVPRYLDSRSWRRCLRVYRWSVCIFGGLNASKGVQECSGLLWCSKCSILEKFHTPDSFEASKYQNLYNLHKNNRSLYFLKLLGLLKSTVFVWLPCIINPLRPKTKKGINREFSVPKHCCVRRRPLRLSGKGKDYKFFGLF